MKVKNINSSVTVALKCIIAGDRLDAPYICYIMLYDAQK